MIGISGSLGDGYTDVHPYGIDAVSSIMCAPMTLEESSERAAELIAGAAEQAVRHMKVGLRVFSK